MKQHEEFNGPGVTVERRSVLRAAGLLAALPFLELPRSLSILAGSSSFDAFTQTWRELTDDFLDDEGTYDGFYMHRLAGAIQGLSLEEVPAMERKVFENERITTGPAFVDGSIFLVRVRMEPGAEIRPHNHPDHIVATTCLEGSCRYRHFEPQGELPPSTDLETPFALRETRSGVMLPGQTSHLTRSRDNLHTFEAGADGAVLADFTIERTKGGAFGMLEVEAEPSDAFLGEYGARWTEVSF